MRTLLFLLLSNVAFSQALKLELEVTRIPVTDSTYTNSTKEKVLIIFEEDKIGIVTTLDTLELHPSRVLVKKSSKLYISKSVYKDIRHDNQLYFITVVVTQLEFAIFITPIKPFKRRIWAINLHSI